MRACRPGGRLLITGVAPTFSFGQNWSEFVDRALTPERIDVARDQTSRFLGLESLDGLTFMDIGCGSGVFSRAAYTLGASHIISFDIDPLSVQCCELMKQRSSNPPHWDIRHGSILDPAFVRSLPKCDVVYSWGVLHHTGDMWTAIRNAASLVKPGGRLFIAIYNKVEAGRFRQYRGSHGWMRLKLAYNRSGPVGKRALEIFISTRHIARWLVAFRNPVAEIKKYKNYRGMSFWYDVVDMLGGYPYEFATSDEIFRFCHRELGLQLENMNNTTSIGCNEFLFTASREVAAPAPERARELSEVNHPAAVHATQQVVGVL